MMVSLNADTVTLALSEETVISIGLAVAQWMRSPRATSIAREQLRARGVDEAEIEERRRCRSADRSLAAVLRSAVTLMITRGRLEDRDRALISTDYKRTMTAIVHATALAFLRVLLANEIASDEQFPTIDLNVGDY